jgi:hypothetical protein
MAGCLRRDGIRGRNCGSTEGQPERSGRRKPTGTLPSRQLAEAGRDAAIGRPSSEAPQPVSAAPGAVPLDAG